MQAAALDLTEASCPWLCPWTCEEAACKCWCGERAGFFQQRRDPLSADTLKAGRKGA